MQPSTPAREEYTGNGLATSFEYTWRIFDESHLLVTLVTIADGTEETLVYPDDYSVTYVGQNGGGTIVTTDTYSSDYKIIITANFPEDQQADYTNDAAVPPERAEESFDLVVGMIKQLQEASDRSVKVSIGSTDDPDDILADLQTAVSDAQAAAVQTAADVVTTAANVALTAADAVATAADRVQTGLDVVAAAASASSAASSAAAYTVTGASTSTVSVGTGST